MAFQQILPDLFLWTDTCNVYVLSDGETALIIDLGDGNVLDHLTELGIRHIDWVLFTHHHREQCQGIEKLKKWDTKIATPEAERSLFEHPDSFRKMNPTLGDTFSVYGSSYVRPPIQPIPIDHVFKSMDEFSWHENEFWCINTRGNSPGSMSYMLRKDDCWIAFTGDVMMDGAKMHTWFDTEWDYGFAMGIYALFNSVCLIESFEPSLMLPSHGSIINNPVQQLKDYQIKLRELTKHYMRGYEQSSFGYADQDPVSTPTSIPHLWQVTPHIFKFKGPEFWPNFGLILADSGHAFVVDCGVDRVLMDKCIERMKEQFGLKQIDAVIITHIHGDHCIDAPYLREKYGAEIWTLDRIADKIQFPLRFDYVAPPNTYGAGIDSIESDRIFTDGESFQWEGYEFTVDWMPGQTEFSLCMHGMIDGKLVAFTGDNIFASTTDPTQNGHEAVVAHNSGILEEGYIYAAEYLQRLQPDLLIGGHSWVMDKPKELIERFRDSAYALRDAFQALSIDPDYRYMFDPFWVRVEPYRITVNSDESESASLKIRNFRDRIQRHHIEFHCPEGIGVDPMILEGEVDASSIQSFNISVKVMPDAGKGLYIVAFDITLDGLRYGELFDMIVSVD